jgi:hypothetical protein
VARADWPGLPAELRRAIENHTGPVLDARPVTTGFGAELLAVLRTAGGEVFVKGMRSGDPRMWAHEAEAVVVPRVPALAPRLLWRVESAAWDVLGFEYVPGRAADFSPGSPDLAAAAGALGLLAAVRAPAGLGTRAEDRWRRWLDQGADAGVLGGDRLIHCDLNPFNFLIGEGEGEGEGDVRLVDWGWSVRGAAWLTPCVWALSLMVEGHSPASAEDWARRLPAWDTAPAGAVTMFAAGICRQWEDAAREAPDAGRRHMAAVARRWVRHRYAAATDSSRART